MGTVLPFCVPGLHAYEGGTTGTTDEGAGLPEGWMFVRATPIGGTWFRDETSCAKVCCCSEHLPTAKLEDAP